jgi:cobalamin biosynthesis protein CobD/CbiB
LANNKNKYMKTKTLIWGLLSFVVVFVTTLALRFLLPANWNYTINVLITSVVVSVAFAAIAYFTISRDKKQK